MADPRVIGAGVVFALVLLAGGLFYVKQGSPGVETTTVTVTVTSGPGGVQEASGHGMDGRDGGHEEAFLEACGGISEYTPEENIRWLLENHDEFTWSYEEYPENFTVVWVIRASSVEAAERLYEHILQMECVLENGGTPREMDPVFRLEAAVYELIHTRVEMVDDTTIRVVKSGENQCAFETIKLHAEVVQGFFERGFDEAHQTHPVPEDVVQLCQPYLDGADINDTPGMMGHGMERMGDTHG